MATYQELYEIFEPLREHAYDRPTLIAECDKILKGRTGNPQVQEIGWNIKAAHGGERVEELLDDLQQSAEAEDTTPDE